MNKSNRSKNAQERPRDAEGRFESKNAAHEGASAKKGSHNQSRARDAEGRYEKNEKSKW